MMPFSAFASLYGLQVQVALTLVEAQTVMAYRCLGLAGLWPSNPQERHRMILEKPPVFAAAGMAASMAALAGKPPEDVLRAAITPLRRTTRANAKRLSRGR